MPGVSSRLNASQNPQSVAAELVVAANSSRIYAEVKNADSAINMYIGVDANLTTANGHLLAPGEAFGFEDYVGPVWCIAASGTPNLTIIEY
jgi:hypothetical protein